MKECITNDPEKASILGQEILPILHEFYGEYDPFISSRMIKIAACLTQFDGGDKNEKLSFFGKTRDHLEITHGIRHPFYLLTSGYMNIII